MEGQAVIVGHQQVGAGHVQGVGAQVDFKLILLQIGKGEKDFKLRLVGNMTGEKGNGFTCLLLRKGFLSINTRFLSHFCLLFSCGREANFLHSDSFTFQGNYLINKIFVK